MKDQHRPKVMITGANGFIGLKLIKGLQDDFRLLPVVRTQNATETNQNVVAVGDYLESKDWKRLLADVDAVVHVAGIITGQREQMMKVNRDITAFLAEQSIQAGVSQFIYLSSMSVYGNGKDRNLTIDSELQLDDDYPASKHAGEVELERLAKNTNMNWVSIRPPMVIGKGTQGTFYSMVKLFAKLGFSPFGSIKSKYPIVTLETLCQFISKSIQHRPIDNGVYLVGEKNEYSVPEIMTKVASLHGKKIRHLPCPKILLRCLLMAMGKAKAFDHLTSNLTIDTTAAQNIIDQ